MIFKVNITFKSDDKLNPYEFKTIEVVNETKITNGIMVSNMYGHHRVSTSLELDVYYINPDIFFKKNVNTKLKISIDQFIREEKLNVLLQ